MGRIHYVLWYRLNRRDRYLLWYCNETDGVVADAVGHIPVFADQAYLHTYAAAHGLPIKQEPPILHDLDAVANWLRRKRPTRPDCQELLAAWNLLADVSNSVGGHFDLEEADTEKIYNKLFWGSNIPAITPPGEHFEPHWSGKEYQEMREVLRGGLHLFRSHMRLRQNVVTPL